MTEAEWIDDADHERRAFLVVCTGGGRHRERTLAKFPVSRRWGLMAGSSPRGKSRDQERRPSYEVVPSPHGGWDVSCRVFFCHQKTCQKPLVVPEAAFIALIEGLLEEFGDLSARRLDLSASPRATLL